MSVNNKISGYLQPEVLNAQPWRDNLDGATVWFFPNAPGDVEVTIILASVYAALEAENARLREAHRALGSLLAKCILALEPIYMSGSQDQHCDDVKSAIEDAVLSIRRDVGAVSEAALAERRKGGG